MQSIASVQSQQFALIVGLRSVGHVLQKVDADTPARMAWLRTAWAEWKREPIFAEFIEPSRNRMIKEFRGWMDIKNRGVAGVGISATPGLPSGADVQVDFNLAAWEDEAGRSMLAQINEGILFWESRLNEAAQAFVLI